MSQRHYNKAPIVEAIIDIQTRFKEQPSLELFKAFHSQVISKFPNSVPIQSFQVGITPENAGANIIQTNIEHSQQQVGLRLSTEKNDRALLVQQQGFTFSHMPPYTDWATFSSEGKTYWETFLRTCKPEFVTRCAIRFINRISIPKPSIKVSDYFNIYPNVPENFSKELNGMFLQIQTPQSDLANGAMAVTNFAMANPDVPGTVTIILDFDLFCTTNLSTNSSDIWDTLNLFRERKNVLFEASITDEIRSLIS